MQYYKRSNTTQYGPSSEPIIPSSNYEILHILWNLQVYYCVRRSSRPTPSPSQMNPVYEVPSYFFQSHLKLFSQVFQWRLFPADFPSNILHAFLFPTLPSIHATHPNHIVLLNLIILIITGVVYKMKFLMTQFSASSSHFLHAPCLPQHPILNTLSLCSSLNVRSSFTPIKKRQTSIF
jgi:hypothetical protein